MGNCLFIYVQTIRFHFSWPIFYILFSVPADALHSKKTIVSNEDNVLELQGFRRQKSGPREKTDERVHGVGSGCEEDTRRSVSAASQRRAVQDSGETLAVSLYFGYSLQLLSDEHEVSIRGFLVEETRRFRRLKANGPRDSHLLPLVLFLRAIWRASIFFTGRMPNIFLPRGAEAARGTIVPGWQPREPRNLVVNGSTFVKTGAGAGVTARSPSIV